jgi:hypothetical protein
MLRRVTDSVIASGGGMRLYLAALTESGVVRVRDSTDWPEETISSYGVLVDRDGRVRHAYEIPTSRSGDWFEERNYYFDSTGVTALFEHVTSSFMGCESVPGDSATGMREFARSHLDGTRILAREYFVTAFDTTVRRDPSSCTALYRHSYKIYPSYDSFADATQLARLYPSIGRPRHN